jgi:energy-coupling factor transport system ATP-binding protein
VLVTHNMDDAARLADHVIVMHAGRIAMEGAPAEVFGRDAELRALGLDLPQAAQLVQELRRRGLAVGDALTMTQARRAILAALRARGRGA